MAERRTYSVNEKTGVYHRDPGCSRIVGHWGKNVKSYEGLPRHATTPCFYCHSAAGRRRYP